MGLTPDRLVARARSVASRAHAPYSGIRVGAVAEDAAGDLHIGVNVESSSYGLTICAERAALARAVADAAGDVVALGVARADGVPISPCGACRQLLVDLAPQARVAFVATHGATRVRTAADLLPDPFVLP